MSAPLPEVDDLEVAMLEMEADFRERLITDPDALEREFIEMPGQIAYAAGRYSRALNRHLRAKIAVKKLWGLLLMAAREELESANDSAQRLEDDLAAKENRKAKDVKSKVTESVVDSRAQQYPRWADVQREEADTDALRELAKGQLAAIMAKKDMVVQLGAARRSELERDPVLRDRQAVQRNQG